MQAKNGVQSSNWGILWGTLAAISENFGLGVLELFFREKTLPMQVASFVSCDASDSAGDA